MTAPSSRWLKSTEWLANQLGKPDLVVLDGSFYLPAQNRNAREEYLKAHIPGAVFFDIDAVADHSTDLPHMLPGPTQFAQMAGALGITETDTVVVYDGAGFFSAPRVWWTFRIFGAKNVFILDGGMPAWLAEKRKTESGEVKRTPRTFNATMETSAVAMDTDVLMALNDGKTQVVDARPAGRASTICSLPSLIAICTSVSIATAPVSSAALNLRGARLASPASVLRPSAFQAGRPPSRMNTFFAPKMRKVHHTRGAPPKPAPS